MKTPTVCRFCYHLTIFHFQIQLKSVPKIMSQFANFKSLTDFTPEELVKLKEHCFARKVEIDSHYFYMGRDSNTYANTMFDFRGQRYHMYRHQLSLFLKKYEDKDFDMTLWDNSKTTSHLCNKKRCINPEHLELEGLDTNMERIRCFEENHCFHHVGAPDCLI